MKNRVLICLLTACLLFAPFALPVTAAESLSFADSLYAENEIAGEARVTFEYDKAEQETRENTPDIGCRAAYVADPVSGKVFFEKNAHAKMYPASTTKILTALLVLENCDVNDTVTVSKSAVAMVPAGYSTAGLKAGEAFSVELLLQALLIPSANEAAYALAEHVSGSVSAFAELCNRRAKELGCETLHFVNPNGVHDKNHYCSAYDLFLIAKECQKHEEFNRIVKMTEFTVPSTELHPKDDRTYKNTNEMLFSTMPRYYLPYCTGIKTGHTTPAGECLVSSSEKDDLNLICVVLGGSIKANGLNERFSDTKKLMEFVYGNYARKLIADHNVPIAQVNVENAVSDAPMLDVIIPSDIVSVAPNEISQDYVDCQISIAEEIKAPIQLHQVLGTVTYRVDGLIYSTNIIAGHEVQKKPFWLYNTLVAAGFVLIVMFIAFFVNRRRQRKKREMAAARRRAARARAGAVSDPYRRGSR